MTTNTSPPHVRKVFSTKKDSKPSMTSAWPPSPPPMTVTSSSPATALTTFPTAAPRTTQYRYQAGGEDRPPRNNSWDGSSGVGLTGSHPLTSSPVAHPSPRSSLSSSGPVASKRDHSSKWPTTLDMVSVLRLTAKREAEFAFSYVKLTFQ